MESLKKVSRTQWCLFVLFIGFAFLMQNCQDDDATIYEENQIPAELSSKGQPVKVTVCRHNLRKDTYSIVTVVAKNVLDGDIIIDADGDGYVNANQCVLGNGIDCDDTNSAITISSTFYYDGDNDSFGNPNDSIVACVAPEYYVTDNTDCDDTNGGITTATIFYHDGDNDTFGDPDDSIVACVAPEYYVDDNTDGDDTDSAINPNADEICNDGKDNNCDGLTDPCTAIPDPKFEEALNNLGYDIDGYNNFVLTANINTITYLSISNYGIDNLTGIEGFTNLVDLNCTFNNLTSLDLSQNTALTELNCSFNIKLESLNVSHCNNLTKLLCYNGLLGSLDVSGNALLTHLFCSDNPISNLDLSNNDNLIALDCSNNGLGSLNIDNCADLEELYCTGNQIQSLVVSNNTALVSLQCQMNQLGSLDVSSNPALTDLSCQANPNLYCIQVTQHHIDYHTSSWFKDANATFSLECGS